MTDSVQSQSRADREKQFHDALTEDLDLSHADPEAWFNAYTALENRDVMNYFGPQLEGQTILDVGCGWGEASIFFAKRKARVSGIDLSPGMVQKAREFAARHGVAVEFKEGSLEKLPYPDASFDKVYGFGILHHAADFEQGVREIHRVLKPGGLAAFVEPLPYNPVINIYRRMATRFRSVDEKPLSAAQIRHVLKTFAKGEVRMHWLLGLVVFCAMYVVERVHPNEEPYWRKVIYDAPRYRRWLAPLLALDEKVVNCPGFRWLAYSSVIRLQKATR